jgi:hypothetical protein
LFYGQKDLFTFSSIRFQRLKHLSAIRLQLVTTRLVSTDKNIGIDNWRSSGQPARLFAGSPG